MQIKGYIAKGQVVPLHFMEAAVAASQTNAQMVLVDVGTSPSLTDGVVMPFAGAVIGISWLKNAAGTAGSLTIGASIDGTEDADTTITISTAASGSKKVPRGKAKFVADQAIGAEITTDGSWLPESSDLLVSVWVLLYLTGI